MALSKEQIAHYREHGWIAPIDIMSEAEAATLAQTLEAAEAKYPEHLHSENRNNAHLAFPFLADLVLHEKIVAAAASLVGADMSLWSSVLFIKEANSGSFVSWHQDATYMALNSDNHVTAWIALTPSIEESGCVAVIPGTHREGIVKHEDTFGEDNILTRGQKVTHIDESQAINLELRPGQMSLHHPWLVHGSLPNKSNQRRIGIAMQSYMGANVKPEYGEHHVMHIQGAAVPAEFIRSKRPIYECDEEGVSVREASNKAFSDVLYEGAKVRRKL
ncbi:MAG: phytanoyl-CoA dioxygenase family protein [Cocleimonas sp.]